LRELPVPAHPNLIGGEGFDDAAVYRIREDLALVATVDVFTPIVDDPSTYGAIAATNALSDIYAMGARPLFALAIGGFPRDKLPLSVIAEIMRGGAERAAEAGIPVAGGHTIENPEPVYGLSVMGEAHPDRIVRNSGGRPGDLLILTKPLGTGLICTAARADAAQPEWLEGAVVAMLRLNRDASEAMLRHEASACTDITGFGLLVHCHELAQASSCSAEIAADAVPWLPGARECLAAGMTAGGLFRNLDHARGFTTWSSGHDDLAHLCADPQTSGGLLIAVPEPNAEGLLADLAQTLPSGSFACLGQLTAGEPGRLVLS
jgi:selenide,water dikinase